MNYKGFGRTLSYSPTCSGMNTKKSNELRKSTKTKRRRWSLQQSKMLTLRSKSEIWLKRLRERRDLQCKLLQLVASSKKPYSSTSTKLNNSKVFLTKKILKWWKLRRSAIGSSESMMKCSKLYQDLTVELKNLNSTNSICSKSLKSMEIKVISATLLRHRN